MFSFLFFKEESLGSAIKNLHHSKIMQLANKAQ